MDPKLLKKITTQIQRRYPEFADCKPKVRAQKSGQAKTSPRPATYVLTFKRLVRITSIPQSKIMPRLMRVVVDEYGQIIKVTTSH